jgi:hypothetical protein
MLTVPDETPQGVMSLLKHVDGTTAADPRRWLGLALRRVLAPRSAVPRSRHGFEKFWKTNGMK